jgi:hypothetical protein
VNNPGVKGQRVLRSGGRENGAVMATTSARPAATGYAGEVLIQGRLMKRRAVEQRDAHAPTDPDTMDDPFAEHTRGRTRPDDRDAPRSPGGSSSTATPTRSNSVAVSAVYSRPEHVDVDPLAAPVAAPTNHRPVDQPDRNSL